MKKTINTTEEVQSVASNKKVLAGVVTSNKMTDTIVVSVQQYAKVPKYNKYVKSHKKYKAHDAGNTKNIGDKVEIVECRPISKDKHFKLI
ncbi:MAG: 30S ribosomal protein S17 [bacterium]